MPALRQRREDIPVLTEQFLGEMRHKMGSKMKVKSISKKAMELLMEHTWPGNVRELRNVIEGAVCYGECFKIRAQRFYFL